MFDLELSLQWAIDIQPGMTVISSWLQPVWPCHTMNHEFFMKEYCSGNEHRSRHEAGKGMVKAKRCIDAPGSCVDLKVG
jgi:hypothetical protein